MQGKADGRFAALWFITAQVTLSYIVAGGAKIISKEWRSGDAMWGVLSTRMYGVVPLGLWLKARPRVSRTLAWGVFGAEFLFGFVLLAPDPIAWALIVGGLGFHAATATLMGLNTFFWAFAAAYPALIWCRFG